MNNLSEASVIQMLVMLVLLVCVCVCVCLCVCVCVCVCVLNDKIVECPFSDCVGVNFWSRS